MNRKRVDGWDGGNHEAVTPRPPRPPTPPTPPPPTPTPNHPLQDAGKLQPGAFYLDRRQQPKHLPLGGTSYSGADVDVLWQKLEAMALPALPVAAPDAL
jgi:hypothetical protein